MPAHSLLIVAYGQSNADVHLAGPSAAAAQMDDPRIVTPDDPFGVRGGMGRPVSFKGFKPVAEAESRGQSLLTAIAGRLLKELDDPDLRNVIIRSEAKGGLRMRGFAKENQTVQGVLKNHDDGTPNVYANLVTTIKTAAEVAEAGGAPVRHIYIVFLHGESDRAAGRVEYADLARDLISNVARDTKDVDAPLSWLVFQAGGTTADGSGNNWPNRLSVLDVADQVENAFFCAASYWLPLVDSIHFSALGKALFGEYIGHFIAEMEKGRVLRPPRPIGAAIAGREIRIRFDTPAPLVIDLQTIPAAFHPFGFELVGGDGIRVENLSLVAEDEVLVVLDKPASDQQFGLCYAYSRCVRAQLWEESIYPFGRGCLRTSLEVPSDLFPGTTLYQWVPAFVLPSSEIVRS